MKIQDMILNERLNNLERRVNEQNEAIKKLAVYTLEILDENDRLWKHIMNDICVKKCRSLSQETNNSPIRFRSKTPPPLAEPKSPEKEQPKKVRKRIEEFNSDIILSILKREVYKKSSPRRVSRSN